MNKLIRYLFQQQLGDYYIDHIGWHFVACLYDEWWKEPWKGWGIGRHQFVVQLFFGVGAIGFGWSATSYNVLRKANGFGRQEWMQFGEKLESLGYNMGVITTNLTGGSEWLSKEDKLELHRVKIEEWEEWSAANPGVV